MNSKLFVFLNTIVLIFTFQSISAADFLYIKSGFDDGKNTKSIRARIYNDEKEKPKTEESVTKKSKVDLDLERRVFDLINNQRVAAGLPPFKWNDDIAKIARLHSENMANENFFSHKGTDGSMVNDRADLFGISKWSAIGENIAYNQGYDKPAESAVEGWMLSEGHRKNILDNRWKESAIGIAISADNKFYFTEVFLSRK